MRIIKQDLRAYLGLQHTNIRWYKNSYYHREDGPASAWNHGLDYYFINGKWYFKNQYWKKIHENY